MFSTIPEGEDPQSFKFGGCLSRRSESKHLVPTQKYIGNANEFLWRIKNGRASVMTVMFINLVTEQIGQNERQKEHEMAVITGTSVSSSLLLICQLLEHVGCDIVYGNQAHMRPMHDMPTCWGLFSQQLSQSARQLLCCCPSDAERLFHTLTELTDNGF